MQLLEDLYRQKLAELYEGERQLLRVLPKVARAVSTPELRTLFEHHYEETKAQARRLEELMARRGIERHKKSKAMAGLLGETKELLKKTGSGDDRRVLTLALVSTAEGVEGHEITGYACAHSLARLLGFHGDLKPLEETFAEEQRMEEKLTAFSETLAMDELEIEQQLSPQQKLAA